MSIRITDDEMVSDVAAMCAEYRPGVAADGAGAWVVSGYPPELAPLGGRLLTRNETITALTVAELIAAGKGDSPHARGFLAELGLGLGHGQVPL